MNHQPYMQRALQLAACGLGRVAPNPMVGAVLVYKDRIIGEGFHQQYGSPHAEVNAIESVKDPSLISKATLYVTLEPCNHRGKTPPCTLAILQNKIPRVIISCVDENPLVKNKGIEALQNAGVEVITGVLEEKGRFLNRRFFTFHEQKRPYIILKWAQSENGYINEIKDGKDAQAAISNSFSQIFSHRWRTEEQAIMVGTNTAVIDNPRLTPRLWKGNRPMRILIDRTLRVPPTHFLLSDEEKTIIYHNQTESSPLAQAKGNKEYVSLPNEGISLILNDLYARNIQSVIIEGGADLLNDFISQDLWDEARVFKSNKTILNGKKAPELPISPSLQENIDTDMLSTYYFKSY